MCCLLLNCIVQVSKVEGGIAPRGPELKRVSEGKNKKGGREGGLMYEPRPSGGVSVSADIINTFFSGFKLKNRINTTFSLEIRHRVMQVYQVQGFM